MDLKQILEDHKLWLDGKGGKWASLPGADLRGVRLRGADLRETDLSGANLSEADLSCANLYGADLSDANLSGAIVKLTADIMKALGVKT